MAHSPRSISRLNPSLPAAPVGSAQAGMLYRQVQFLVEEGDWASRGEELEVLWRTEERDA